MTGGVHPLDKLECFEWVVFIVRVRIDKFIRECSWWREWFVEVVPLPVLE